MEPVAKPSERAEGAGDPLLELARLDLTRLDAALEALTELSARALRVERVSVWIFSEDRSSVVCRSLFVRCARRHERGETLFERDYPSYFEALSRERVIAARDARRDLRTRQLQPYLVAQGIYSMMDVPVWLGGRVVGVLCTEHTGALRLWLPEEQELAIHHLADTVSLALQVDQHRRNEIDRRRLARDKHVLTAESRRRTIAWRAVVSSITDAVWIIDSNSQVLFANDAATMLFGVGCPPDSQSHTDLVERYEMFDALGEKLEPGRWPAARALLGETVRGTLVRMVSRSTGSSKFFRVSAAPVEDPRHGVRQAVLIASDVTVEANFDQMRRAFIAAAAHELKTPIAIVLAYAQLASEGAGGSSALEAIERGARRLDRLVRDLIGASTIERLELTPLVPVDVSELVREVVADLAQTTTRHRVTAHADQAVIVDGDRERLAQVLSNLIGNAIKFSPGGGDIDVDVTVAADQVTIRVRDHGIGIPLPELAGVFDVGRDGPGNAPHRLEGLGIGLYLTRELISRHGGTISIDSAEGQGTTVQVALPLREAA